MVRQYIHSWQSGVPVDHFTARSIIDALLTVPSGQLVPPTSLMLVLNILEQQERHPDGPDVSWDCLPLVEALAAQPAMPDRAAHLRALMDRVGDGRLVLDRPHPGLWRPLRKLYTSASHWAAAAHVFKLAKDAPGTAADLLARVVRFAFADAPVMERADFLACVQWSGLSPRFAGPLGAAYVETLAARVRATRDEDEAVWALRTVVAVEGALKGRDPDATSRDPDRNRSAYRDAVTRALKAIAAAGIDARTAQFKLKKPESRGLDKNTRESILDEFRAIVEADAATINPQALQGKVKPPHLLSSKAKADIHAAVQSVLRMFEMEFGDADGGAERKGRTELTGGGKKAKSASNRAAVSG